MELTPEQLKALVQEAVAEYESTHPCRLTDPERAMVHAQHEAMVEEGANHGTFRILFQWGVSVKDITKQVRRAVLVILGLLTLVFGAKAIMGG